MVAGILPEVAATLPGQVPSPLLAVSGAAGWLFLVLGVVFVVSSIIDLLWTTLWVDGGAGPLTAVVMAATWRGLRALGERQSRVLSLSGPLVLLLTLLVWIGMLWAGWVFVFSSGVNALTYTRGPDPVGWIDRIYFVAYTMFTMGNGDFTPTTGGWRLVTSLVNGSGMAFVTLSITYVINVIQAVVEKRSFASSVQGVGTDSETFASTGWTGDDFAEHDLPLDTFVSQLSTIAAQHNAYPILHYYRSREQRYSAPVAVAIFDDALTVLRFGVTPEDRPNEPLLETSRSSVEDYLKSVYSLPLETAAHPPPAPELTRVREQEIPTVSDDEFADSLEELADRRRRVLGVVESQEWQWPATKER